MKKEEILLRVLGMLETAVPFALESGAPEPDEVLLVLERSDGTATAGVAPREEAARLIAEASRPIGLLLADPPPPGSFWTVVNPKEPGTFAFQIPRAGDWRATVRRQLWHGPTVLKPVPVH